MMTTCSLCFHHCMLSDGQVGICRARANHGGQIVSLNYGQLAAVALDPIEKKPLRRFYPGSQILSVGSFGCNLRCPFCQNAEISMAEQAALHLVYYSPEALVDKALSLRSQGNIGIAYTYNEPLIGYEYVRDCALIAKQQQLKNVLVTNGTIEEAPLLAILPLIDALNIDLKGFTPAWYQRLGGDLSTVKRSIALSYQYSHIEVTTLLIPGENDSDAEIQALAHWLASIDPEIPLHLSRFFPRYRLTDRGPTPVERVYHLADIARQELRWVYTGNC